MRRSSIWSDPRVKPPYGSVEIDWSHSLARGLVACALLNESGGTGYDRVSGQVLIPSSSPPAWKSSVQGAAFNFPNDATVYSDIPAGWVTPVAYSVWGIGVRAASGVIQNMLDHDDAASGTTRFWQLRMTNADNGQVIVFDTGPNTVTGVTTFLTGPMSLGFSAIAGGQIQLALNGKVDATGTAAAGLQTPNRHVIRIGRFYQSAVQPWNGTIAFAAGWSRALTIAEFNQLHTEPYTFFRPLIRRSYFVPSGAAVTARNIPSLMLTGVGV